MAKQSLVASGPQTSDAVTFDDIYLVPQYSEIDSRDDVSITTSLKYTELASPIIAANMDSVCEAEMAHAMAKHGGLGVIHRYMTNERQVDQVIELKKYSNSPDLPEYYTNSVAVAVGVKNGVEEHVQNLYEHGATIFVIDVAHGHHKKVKETIKKIRDLGLSNIEIVAGNVATPDGAMFLFDAGADTIKVGVGPGAVCTTRSVTGHGVPQLQALFDIFKILHRFDGHMIADGGIRAPGDILKALAAGASAVMVGSMVAGTDEAPGEIIEKKYKIYRGMASSEAQRDFYGNDPDAPEGITTVVPYKGSVHNILKFLEAGLKSGLSYSGASNIQEFRKKVLMMKVTQAGAKEAGTI
jgi:IMP dehydrogenase